MGIRTTKGRGKLYASILDTVGDTPVIRINRIAPKNVTVYVKFEAFNPAGSVKDRLALNIIEAAERDGQLKPGANHRRGDLWQYRHRPCDGLRRQGLSAGCHDGRQFFSRTSPPDAVSGR